MSSNNANDLLSTSGGELGSAPWLLKHFYVVFAKLWIPVQLTLAAIGLGIAIYFGIALRQSLLNAHRSIATVFASKVEPTRSAEQGIVAFLLSAVKDEWSKVDNLNTGELNPVLQKINIKVQEETARAQHASVSAGPIINRLNLETSYSGTLPGGETWQTAIVSERNESYVAVPAITLRRKSLNEPPLAATKSNDRSRLTAALENNPEIVFDLNLVAELEPMIKELENASSEKLKVIQTYFITESGVFLIRATGVKEQSSYYRDQFRPYTLHLDRPYVWGAVDINPVKPTPFDYSTRPYLDLGGNGFVVTFSKKFDLPNHRVGVLCLDAKLPDDVTDEIESHLKELGARVSDFYWNAKTGLEPGKLGPLPPQFSWFDSKLRTSNAKSDVMGRVTTEPIGSSLQSPEKGGKLVRFTVPIGSGEYGSGVKKTRFLWVEFDSDAILRMLTKNLAFFTGGITVVIAVTFSLFWDYTRLKREMSNVLEKMSNVMRNAETPFVWLDEKNEFVKVNKSMLAVLGYKNLDELKRYSPTFKGLLTDESQDIYIKILDTSGAGEDTGEYEISIITKSGNVLNVRAHGERIPYPTWWRRGLPHRFGIFVEVTQPARSSQAEPINV